MTPIILSGDESTTGPRGATGAAGATGATGPATGAASGDLAGNYPSPTLAAYRTIYRGAARIVAATVSSATTFLAAANGVVGITTASSNWLMFTLIAADWAAAGKTTQLRLLAGCNIGDVAPTNTHTWGLYPVTAVTGANTVNPTTLGAVIAGSTVALTTPAANSITAETSSGAFAFPADGLYMIGFASSAGMAANSAMIASFALQVRNV